MYVLNAYITCSMHINKIQHNDAIHMTIRGFIKNVQVFEHLDCIVLSWDTCLKLFDVLLH